MPHSRHFFTAAAMLVAASSALAQNTDTWVGSSGTDWNNAANWSPAALPATGDSLVFGAAGTSGTTLTDTLSGASFFGITFNSSASAYTTGGSAFTLTGGGITNSSTSASQIINQAITLSGANTLTTTAGGNITLGGVVSGTNGLTVTGAGTTTLSGNNTYTGATAVTGGTLIIGPTNNAATTTLSSSSYTLGNASTLRFDVSNVTNGAGIPTAALGTTSLSAGTTVELYTTATNHNNPNTNTAVIQGVFSGAGNLNIEGGGSMDLNTVNALSGFAGALNVNNGTLSLQGASTSTVGNFALSIASTGTLDLRTDSMKVGTLTGSGNIIKSNGGASTFTLGNDNGSGVYSGVIGSDGNNLASISLVKAGTGTQTLSGANRYTGATTVNGGVLAINGSTAAGSAVTVNSGGALGGAGTVGGAVTVAAGGGVNLTTDSAVGTLTLGGTLTFNGTATNRSSVTFDLSSGGTTTDMISATGAVTASTANSVVVNLRQLAGTVITPGTYTLINSAATSNTSGLVLATTRSGGNVYSLTTTASGTGGVLQLGVTTAAAGPTSAVWSGASDATWETAGNWNTDATSNTGAGAAPGVGTNVTFATTTPGAGNLTTTLGTDYEINSLTFNTGGVGISGAHMLTIDAASGITANNTTGTNSIAAAVGLGRSQTWTVASGGALTISGAITDFGGNLGLTKAGAGTLTLTGMNTYTGATAVTGGTLIIGPTNNAATTTLSSLSYTLGNASTLRFDLSNVTNGTGIVTAALGTTSLSAGTTVELYTTATNHNNPNTNTAVIQGVFSGAGNLNIEGGGSMDLNNVNALSGFAGALNVNNGTLSLQGASTSTVGNFALSIASTGTLDLRTDSMKVGTLTGSGNIIKSNGGASTFTLGNDNGSGVYSGVIGSDGNNLASISLVKAGTGTQTLSGANRYTGATTISVGSLLINGSLASGSTVSVASGAILGGTGTVSGTVSVSGTLQGGAGAASGALTLGGGVTLQSGSIIQLALGAPGAASTLARTGSGTWTFSGTQQFTFLNIGGAAAPGAYTLITGLASDPGSEASWTITNAGWVGTFSYAANTISLNLTAVPEPGTYGLIGAGALAAVALVRRRRKLSGFIA